MDSSTVSSMGNYSLLASPLGMCGQTVLTQEHSTTLYLVYDEHKEVPCRPLFFLYGAKKWFHWSSYCFLVSPFKKIPIRGKYRDEQVFDSPK